MSNVDIRTSPLPFGKQLQEFKKFKDAYPRFVGNLAVNFFKDSFRRQGFIDRMGVERWPARKPGWGKKDKNKGRALLVKSGRLRRSIRIVRTGLGYVQVGTDLPYAQIHNEGGVIRTTQNVGSYTRKAHSRTWKGKRQSVSAATVSAHRRKMNFRIPQRQFMGPSVFLVRRILMNSEYKIKRILNIR